MGIQIGSQIISKIFTQTYSEGLQPPSSGSVIGLQSGSYSNGSTWTSTTGSAGVVNNSPLASGSNGRWQFNGTDEYILISSSQLSSFNQAENANQEFTFLFYGTIGSVSTRRALLGNGKGGSYNFGGDAILRTDSSPGAGKMHLDLRGPTGATNRFTVTAVSGSLLNLAITQNTAGTASVYQDGIFLASSGTLPLGFAPFTTGSNQVGAYIGFNGDVDTDNYNGQLGASYLYNRVLSTTEISQSAISFYSGSAPGMIVSPITSVFLGTSQVFSTIVPITSMSVLSLVVGGGGAGGVGTAGGGGAGGMVTGSLSLTASTYTVTVGAGGASSAGPVGLNASTQSGNPGQTSSFATLVAFGGGGGFAYEGSQNTSNGGSGGGCSDTRLRQPAGGSVVLGGSGSAGQGNNGGTGTYGQQFGAGGGGASQVGQNGNAGVNPRIAGAGGSGSINTFRDGTSRAYAGGGGAAGYNTALGGAGGFGGGGTGGGPSGGSGVTGSANTGGGGGGSNRNVNGTVNGVGAGGGSGIVVIAYLTSSFSASVFTSVSGGIVQDFTSGSQVYRSHTFLSSSNLVIS